MTVRGLSLSGAALAYAKANVAVFPLRAKSKAPYGRTVGLHMASRDPALTASRWAGAAQLPLKPIEVLREERIGGRQLFSEFMTRRFDPAIQFHDLRPELAGEPGPLEPADAVLAGDGAAE